VNFGRKSLRVEKFKASIAIGIKGIKGIKGSKKFKG
jgi:hypothetical protein